MAYFEDEESTKSAILKQNSTWVNIHGLSRCLERPYLVDKFTLFSGVGIRAQSLLDEYELN